MEKIKTLSVQLDSPLNFGEVPKFRAAVIEATGRISDLYHNHMTDNKVLYRYPLIQYRSNNGKAGLFCLGAGTDVIHYFMQARDQALRIGKRIMQIQLDQVELDDAYIGVCDEIHSYSLLNWQALNSVNFREYQQLAKKDPIAQIEFLQRILTGNILSACSGLSVFLEQRFELKINDIKAIRAHTHKARKIMLFDISFSANIKLPARIGLGKGVSVGLGVLSGEPKPIIA
jgi:hypothetical protein